MKKHEVIKAINCLSQLKLVQTAAWFEIYKNIKNFKDVVKSIEEDRIEILSHDGVFNEAENVYEFADEEKKEEALELVASLLEEEVVVSVHQFNLSKIKDEKHSADLIGLLIELNIIVDDTEN